MYIFIVIVIIYFLFYIDIIYCCINLTVRLLFSKSTIKLFSCLLHTSFCKCSRTWRVQHVTHFPAVMATSEQVSFLMKTVLTSLHHFILRIDYLTLMFSTLQKLVLYCICTETMMVRGLIRNSSEVLCSFDCISTLSNSKMRKRKGSMKHFLQQ